MTDLSYIANTGIFFVEQFKKKCTAFIVFSFKNATMKDESLLILRLSQNVF